MEVALTVGLDDGVDVVDQLTAVTHRESPVGQCFMLRPVGIEVVESTGPARSIRLLELV